MTTVPLSSPENAGKSVPFLGAHIPAADAYAVVTNDFPTPDIDADFILRVADLADADARVERHHRALFDIDTSGRIHGLREIHQRIADLVESGRFVCQQIADRVKGMQPDIIIPGSNQPRTVAIRVAITLYLMVAAWAAIVDSLLLRSLIADVAPEKLADFAFMAAMVSQVWFAIGAFKAATTLAAQDANSYAVRCRWWSRLLPWAAFPLLLALAWRYHLLSTNPVASLLDENSSHQDMLGLAVFFIQLAAQAAVGTGALLSAERLAHDTRPEIRQPNAARLTELAQLNTHTKLLDENRNLLGLAQSKLAALEAELAAFLNRAAAALEEERRERRAIQLEIKALRRAHE